MFTTGWAAREGGPFAGLRTYLPLRRTTLTQQLTHRKSAEQWNGRGFRSHHQTRLRPRQSLPNAETVMHQLSSWITHYNEVHPHKALGYRSPREFIAARGNP